MSNKAIVITKIAAACVLFFCGCLFFFQHADLFWEDIKSFNPLPLVFFIGLVLVCIYISHLMNHLEDDDLYRADRLDIAYRIVFTVTLLCMGVRMFLSALNVPLIVIILAVTSGAVTLLVPRIVENDNEEF